MDIKELDKKQLILLTLLITFVVSIATGIITVSLMNQMPKSVPQTINNVIQRTIEKVTTVEVPVDTTKKIDNNFQPPVNNNLFDSGEVLVSIYKNNLEIVPLVDEVINVSDENNPDQEERAIGQGIIISDVGLILVDSNLVSDNQSYKVMLDKEYFNVSILKKFDNGFMILKILPKTKIEPISQPETKQI